MSLIARTFSTTHTTPEKAVKCEVYDSRTKAIVSAGHGKTAKDARARAVSKLPEGSQVIDE